MAGDDLISSDDSHVDSTPITRTRPIRNKAKVTYELDLTSDSDDEKIVFKKVKKTEQNEIMLGEISLLTSDEDYVIETPPPKKKATRKTVTQTKPKKVKTIEILTSDEEPPRTINPLPIRKKRTLSGTSTDKITEGSPKKKAKVTPKKKLLQQKKPSVTKKPTVKAAAKITVARCSIDSPNVNLDISLDDMSPTWKESELLAERTQIDEEIAKNLIKLWEEGNTIPFIARYRKNVIGDMTPDELRTSKEDYDEICVLKKKMCTVAKTAMQLGKLNDKLQGKICSVKTVEELEHIYAPFKSNSKGLLVERAKKCGLEEPALHLLNNTDMVNFNKYVNPNIKDVKTVKDVEKGIIHIIASEMATDHELLQFLRNLKTKTCFKLISKRTRQINKGDKNSAETSVKVNKKAHGKNPKDEESKFEMYLEFDQRVDHLKSHQILAINRGEALKILSVKIEIPDSFEEQFKSFCSKKWAYTTRYDRKRQEIISAAIDDAFQRPITSLITREIRAELKLKAEKESCKVFSDNLKHLILTPPVKGKAILAIDPGYFHGCKLALISPTGCLLTHGVVYPHNNSNGYRGEQIIKDMLLKHKCNLIAIGNGTACRQTEEWICTLIKNHYFGNLDVQYTIVNEDGASIYSCSPEARKEFGSLDPNIISAVSLARRIQDPMAELVKVEPCHLGVGMYQLDIKKKQLEEALSEVVSECVSFVGVDLNTASQCLLRRVAGLSDKKATQIIDHRERNGPFIYRRQLIDVYGIGERVFEQCAGFLRVGPTNLNDLNFYKEETTTPLDATIIHPESYPIVRSLLGKMNLKERDVGSDHFIRNFMVKSKEYNVEQLAKTFKTDKQTIQLIFDALSKSLNHDLRTETSKAPLFKTGITSMEDLTTGTVLTGRVKNVTSFGAFVDIGVEKNGLVHTTAMKGLDLHLGDVVEVKVKSIEIIRGRIQLQAIKIIK